MKLHSKLFTLYTKYQAIKVTQHSFLSLIGRSHRTCTTRSSSLVEPVRISYLQSTIQPSYMRHVYCGIHFQIWEASWLKHHLLPSTSFFSKKGQHSSAQHSFPPWSVYLAHKIRFSKYNLKTDRSLLLHCCLAWLSVLRKLSFFSYLYNWYHFFNLIFVI